MNGFDQECVELTQPPKKDRQANDYAPGPDGTEQNLPPALRTVAKLETADAPSGAAEIVSDVISAGPPVDPSAERIGLPSRRAGFGEDVFGGSIRSATTDVLKPSMISGKPRSATRLTDNPNLTGRAT